MIANQFAQPVILQTSNGFLIKTGPNDIITVNSDSLNMNGKKISNVGDPTENGDATNKKHVVPQTP